MKKFFMKGEASPALLPTPPPQSQSGGGLGEGHRSLVFCPARVRACGLVVVTPRPWWGVGRGVPAWGGARGGTVHS